MTDTIRHGGDNGPPPPFDDRHRSMTNEMNRMMYEHRLQRLELQARIAQMDVALVNCLRHAIDNGVNTPQFYDMIKGAMHGTGLPWMLRRQAAALEDEAGQWSKDATCRESDTNIAEELLTSAARLREKAVKLEEEALR